MSDRVGTFDMSRLVRVQCAQSKVSFNVFQLAHNLHRWNCQCLGCLLTQFQRHFNCKKIVQIEYKCTSSPGSNPEWLIWASDCDCLGGFLSGMYTVFLCLFHHLTCCSRRASCERLFLHFRPLVEFSRRYAYLYDYTNITLLSSLAVCARRLHLGSIVTGFRRLQRTRHHRTAFALRS